MANESKKTEHSGSKKGSGAYWGYKKDAKHESNKKRREDGKALAGDSELMDKIDSYSYHEALDRTHIQLCNLENALGDHPVILAEKEVKALYDKAVENLAKLYQKLGGIILEK